jgi:hypothetical protein
MADDDPADKREPDAPKPEDGPKPAVEPLPDNPVGDGEWEDDPESRLSPADRRRLQDRVRRIKVFSLGTGDAFGGDQINYLTFHAPGTDNAWYDHPLTSDQRRGLLERFAGTPARARLSELLLTERVVVLQGRIGTGRRTTALAALAMRATTTAVIDGTGTPAMLGPGDIKRGHGYVYDATEADWAKHLTETKLLGSLETLASRDVRLVILAPPDADTAAVRDCVVTHEPPDPWDVLARHLACALPDRDPAGILADLPCEPRSPADAAKLAEALAHGLCRGMSIKEICDSRPDPLRSEVRALLQQEDRNKDLGRRAFMIAWAVLDGLSTVEICKAAQALAELLFAEESRHQNAKLGLLPFGAYLDQWLGYARHDPPEYADELDRRLTSRPGFADAVLDVVWFDYVVAHRPLLNWLEDLIANQDPVVRLKAALAVGRLATHDYDYIERRCFLHWSHTGMVVLHQATAWALEAVLCKHPQRKDQVLARAARWAKSKDLREQSTAARLYGTLLGAREPIKAMHGLRRIASHSAIKLGPTLRFSVVEIFALGARTEVVEQLLDWTDSPFPAVRQLAARCLAELAQLHAPEGPPLLALYDEAPGPVIELWRRVLMSPVCGPEPWKALRAWGKNGVDFTSLRERLEDEPEIRKRLRFHIDRRIDRPRDEGATA